MKTEFGSIQSLVRAGVDRMRDTGMRVRDIRHSSTFDFPVETFRVIEGKKTKRKRKKALANTILVQARSSRPDKYPQKL
jgi:hypothetical protein